MVVWVTRSLFRTYYSSSDLAGPTFIVCSTHPVAYKNTKTLRYGARLVLPALRQQNDNRLVICSLCSRRLLDSITSHFGRSLPCRHHLSCSHLALPRSFDEAAMSFRRVSVWWTYIRHRQVSEYPPAQALSSDRLLSTAYSPGLHEKYAREVGRNVRLRGIHPVRICRVCAVGVSHVDPSSFSSGNCDCSRWTQSRYLTS